MNRAFLSDFALRLTRSNALSASLVQFNVHHMYRWIRRPAGVAVFVRPSLVVSIRLSANWWPKATGRGRGADRIEDQARDDVIRKSLDTSDPREAISRVRFEAYKLDSEFETKRRELKSVESPPTIQTISDREAHEMVFRWFIQLEKTSQDWWDKEGSTFDESDTELALDNLRTDELVFSGGNSHPIPMPKQTGLLKRNGRYYINRRVPNDLRGVYKTEYIRKSLMTSDRREALDRLHYEAFALNADFAAKRRELKSAQPFPVISALSDREAHEMVSRWLVEHEKLSEQWYFERLKTRRF